MAGKRNKTIPTIVNESPHYKELLDRRGVKRITHYVTPIFRHPTINQRASINTVGHVWAYGDRFYNLAHQYYGDARYWWVIAWWNGHPTEVSIQTGDFLDIPLDLNAALSILESSNVE
jgi:hypothetical protein